MTDVMKMKVALNGLYAADDRLSLVEAKASRRLQRLAEEINTTQAALAEAIMGRQQFAAEIMDMQGAINRAEVMQ